MDDPYELERLADELALRESDGTNDDVEYHLPLLAPLSHEHPQLSSANLVFDVEAFLLSRPNTSLPDLRTELRDYLAKLKEELVQLINDDYAAFISLSTDLRGEGARLERLKFPLGDIKDQFQQSCLELQQVEAAVQTKLEERASLREEKALLHLLLKLSDSTARLESLLLIASPVDTTSQVSDGLQALGLGNKLSLEEEEKSRGGRAKHLTRVATEYMQLLYHTEKARSKQCEFVNELRPRIDRIKATLSRDLDHTFSTAIMSLASATDSSASEKARWTADLAECFKSYEVLGSWRDAEEVIRRDLVRPFLKKTIFSGALSVPHSPVLPRTPFSQRESTTGILSPTSPRKNPFDRPLRLDGDGIRLALLDETDDALAGLYNKLLRFVEKNCRGIMEISYSISKPLGQSTNPKTLIRAIHEQDGTETKEADSHGQAFEIMANVVWAEISQAITEELGSVVFAAGQPDELKQHYTTTQSFVTALEFLAPNLHAVETMRAHPTFVAFEKRWQLPVYFQLRWKQIVGTLEEALTTESSVANTPPSRATNAVLHAIARCWSPEVYIPELGHRFWRLTLQILSRYKSFLNDTLATKFSTLSSEEMPRPSTPIPSSAENAENSHSDDASLKHFTSTISDIKYLEKQLMDLWNGQIKVLLPETPDLNEGESVQDTFQHSLNSLTSVVSELGAQIVAILVRRCSDTVLQVRQIPSQIRSMSQKKEPTEPSHFVPGIMKPVRLFFTKGGAGHPLRDEFAIKWTTEIFEAVSSRYASYLAAMKKSEESLRRLKKGTMRSPFSLFGPTTQSQSEQIKDEERVRLQMILDVKALAKDARLLGVDVQSSVAYANLKTIASQSDSQ